MVHVQFNPALLETVRDKVVVLTGGATGIGRETIKIFHKNGAKVVFGDVADGPATQLTAELASENVTYLRCDITSYSDQLQLFAKAQELHGRVDIVIANAGMSITNDPFAIDADITKEPPTKEIDVNLKGCFFTTRIGMSYLRQNGGGDLVLTSSIAGFKECTGLTLYTATKHGVIGIMRGLHLAAIQENIRVNVICPWMTRTAMVKEIETGWDELKLPANNPEDVGMAIVMCSTANRGNGKTHGGAVSPFAGKIVWVAGGEPYEIEDGIQSLEPQWLGAENSKVLEAGQAYLMRPGTSWAAPKK